MKLNRDNYEEIMFEMLEGNLSIMEKREVLEQIKKNTFYESEWKLIQSTVLIPDLSIKMPGKEKLLKPITPDRKVIAFSLYTRMAATLLLICLLTMVYHNPPYSETVAFHTKPMKRIGQESINNHQDTPVQPGQKQPESIQFSNKHQKYNTKEVVVQSVSETMNIAPNIGFIEMKSYGINGFKTGQEVKEIHKVGEVSVIRSIKSIGKVKQNILYAKSIRIQTLALLKEIPNMKIKVTPKIKDRKPILKLEIEGNSIYANAIIEIK